MALPFHSPYRHGFVRVAACVPHGRVADPMHNAARIAALARQASERGAALAVFPELGLSAYSNDDLFHQDALQQAVLEALAKVVDSSRELSCVLLVGAPLALADKLYNCAVAVYRGRVLGVVPKSYLPNYREFYEKRHFASGRQAKGTEIALLDGVVPFGCDLLFHASAAPGFVFHVELCEDLWVPIPPSTYAAMAGATILANLSASNATVGKSTYRRNLCAMHSARCMAGYVYSGAGFGESTTDLAWDGHALVCENGEVLAESKRFAADEQVVLADIDVDRLRQDRTRMTSYADASDEETVRLRRWRTIAFDFVVPDAPLPLLRKVPRFPYVPSDPAARDERCADVYEIQVQGLAKRLQSTRIEKVVIGISGGLDSAHALTVSVKALERLGLPRSNVLAYTMPGFATSRRTLRNATALMKAMGVNAHRLDIRPAALRMLRDIGHPAARGEPVYDVTFENVQAGLRTAYLFRLANKHGGLVVGTSDLSELALGWTTYGVGDQMSHYAVNASVPKTLIQYLVRWVIETRQFDAATRQVLQRVLDTAISPELVPSGSQDTVGQRSEEILGPYALHDFFLYYISRFGFLPSKVAFLAQQAWESTERGDWPAGLPAHERRSYTLPEIVQWLEVFLERFFRTSQFKRSALPNAPKVGSGGSLSPRGDWRAPSDSEATLWLEELRRNVPSME
ncbi:MAG TPA: NAD(+) synthase [Gemmatimonadaceae bacterium]|nr:NAD(+) synthase [Gemmatimonadaceae bacterium]